MVQEPVQDGGSEGAVVVEDLRPVSERTVRRNDNRALFVAKTYDLKEKIGAVLIDGQITQFIQAEYSWAQVSFELDFQAICGMGSGERVDGIDGSGKEDGFAVKAGGITQSGSQVGFPLM